MIGDRDENVAEGNLDPSSALPDYGDIDVSESYVALMTLPRWKVRRGFFMQDRESKGVTRELDTDGQPA